MDRQSEQRTFFVNASRSSVDEVERVFDADLDTDRIWIDAIEWADEMIAVDFWTYGADLDIVEAALQEKLQRAGFRTVAYTERFNDSA